MEVGEGGGRDERRRQGGVGNYLYMQRSQFCIRGFVCSCCFRNVSMVGEESMLSVMYLAS